MKRKFNILKSFWFIGALFLLLLNDFFLKDFYHNWFTGKLSDFAGLLIFPLFWTVLFPKHKNKIFVTTCLIFIYWKSPYSQHFIDNWNYIMFFPIGRVVDASDLIALFILPVSYYLESRKDKLKQVSIHPVFPLVISCFAFMATSQPYNEFDYNKKFDFPFSKAVLIEQINLLNVDTTDDFDIRAMKYGRHKVPLSMHYENANEFEMRGMASSNDTTWLYISNYSTYEDTMFKYKEVFKPNENGLFQYVETNEIDTIYHRKRYDVDTCYIGPTGVFNSYFYTKEHMEMEYFEFMPAQLRLEGNDSTCSLTLLKVYGEISSPGIFAKKEKKEAVQHQEQNLLKAFKLEFIDQIIANQNRTK